MTRLVKSDATEADIVAGLRAAGCSVRLNRGGDGWPDLAVGRQTFQGKRVWLLEVKSKVGKLTPAQERWLEGWSGQYAVVRTLEEALAAVELGYLVSGRQSR